MSDDELIWTYEATEGALDGLTYELREEPNVIPLFPSVLDVDGLNPAA